MKNEIVRCKCVDLSIDGQGIAKAGSLVVFVKGMIIGEVADVKIIKEKKDYSIGIIENMIETSEYRIPSNCSISYKCGGCDFRHIDYQFQMKLKKQLLENILKDYEVADIIEDENPYYYRNKVQIPVREHKMGFYRKNSNDIVVFEDCLIESKIANQIISDLKGLLIGTYKEENLRHIVIRHGRNTGEVMIAFIVKSFSYDFKEETDFLVRKYPNIVSVILNLNDKDTNVILGTEERILYGRDYIEDIYDGIKVHLSLKSFYQVNHGQMLKLYAQIKDKANVSKDDRILDLYCGIGTISLYMARYAKEVTGVEIVEEAIMNANENAKINSIDNVSFVLADASKNMDIYMRNKDIVIVDPPRKGLSKELIYSIIQNKIEKIIYVSCNPITLARDLKLFREYYEISEIQPVDMFPFTVHCECVTSLKRK